MNPCRRKIRPLEFAEAEAKAKAKTEQTNRDIKFNHLSRSKNN
jgi:hypothetical protein